MQCTMQMDGKSYHHVPVLIMQASSKNCWWNHMIHSQVRPEINCPVHARWSPVELYSGLVYSLLCPVGAANTVVFLLLCLAAQVWPVMPPKVSGYCCFQQCRPALAQLDVPPSLNCESWWFAKISLGWCKLFVTHFKITSSWHSVYRIADTFVLPFSHWSCNDTK